MHIVFIEPRFPANQKQFIRALAEIGATRHRDRRGHARTRSTTSCKHWLTHYEEVGNVTDEAAGARRACASSSATRTSIGSRRPSRRTSCRPRRCARPPASPARRVRTAYPVPRQAGDEGGAARRRRAVRAVDRRRRPPPRSRAFAERVGYPLILKPRDGAGASGATRVDSDARARRRARDARRRPGRSVAVEEFIEGHEGFYDTLTLDGAGRPRVRHATTTRTSSRRCARAGSRRSSSPPTASTARRLRRGARRWAQQGRRAARHRDLGDAHGVVLRAQGPEVLRDRLPSAGRARVGPLQRRQRHGPLPRVGDARSCAGRPAQRPSRRFAAGIIALRPDRDGRITRLRRARGDRATRSAST